MRLRRRVVNKDIEKQVLIGFITSDKINHALKSLIDPKLFQLNVGQKISKWIKDYYSLYNRAPGKDIQEIYLAERSELNPEDALDIEEFLKTLSEQYLENPPNEDYLQKQAEVYLKKQSFLLGIKEASLILESSNGDMAAISAAEAAVARSQKATIKNVPSLDPCNLSFALSCLEDDKTPLLTMPEPLGSFIGPLHRGYVLGILGSQKRGKCLTGDNEILLSDGRVKKLIDVIKDKEKNIVTLSKDGKLIKGTVADFWKNGEKPVIKIKTKTGREIKITLNHPLLTYKGWKEVKDLSLSDFIAVPRKIDFFGTVEWPEYKIKILSYLLAEGMIGSGNICFTNGEKKIREDFSSMIKLMGDTTSETTEEITLRIKKDQEKLSSIPTKTKTWLKEIKTKLVKSEKKEIPEIVFSLTKDNLKLFLSVLFTCDGTIWKSKTGVVIGYASASKKLIHQVQHLLLRFGIIGKISKKKTTKNSNYQILFGDKENVITFINEIGFIFSKQEKAIDLLSSSNSLKLYGRTADSFPTELAERIKQIMVNKQIWSFYKSINPFTSRISRIIRNKERVSRSTVKEIGDFLKDQELISIANSDILWDKIESIIDMGMEQTYDLSISETHNFVSNDIIAHNTWWAQNFLITALEERLRVVFISLEMPYKKLVKRFWQQLGCFPEKDGNYEFPFFDCSKNKYNTCKKTSRICDVKYGEQGYIPCDICKVKEGLDLTISLHSYHKKGIDSQKLTKKIKNFHLMHGKNNVRFLCYPMFSANLTQIINDIDVLEWREDFIPDVIVLDYPAILKEERETSKEYSAFGETWKTIKRIAEEKQVLFIAPLQTDRKGGDSEHLKISHTAGYVQIIAHMDICITLNQNETDYEQRVMRIGKIADRWTEMQPGKELIALSQLQCGQPYLGSRLVKRKNNKN
jgi:intein/homing endonuclease